MRPTNRASVGLSVKAAVSRIMVFTGAIWAHDEFAHGSIGPVIRKGMDYGETWAAIGAISERVAVTAVSRVKYFRKAIRTGSNIGENKGGLFSFFQAVLNFKPGIASGLEPGDFQSVDYSPRRFLKRKPSEEFL